MRVATLASTLQSAALQIEPGMEGSSPTLPSDAFRPRTRSLPRGASLRQRQRGASGSDSGGDRGHPPPPPYGAAAVASPAIDSPETPQRGDGAGGQWWETAGLQWPQDGPVATQSDADFKRKQMSRVQRVQACLVRSSTWVRQGVALIGFCRRVSSFFDRFPYLSLLVGYELSCLWSLDATAGPLPLYHHT